MSNEESVLTGTTLQVYRYAIRQGKPVGVREVQRALDFNSPSSASYHLVKLEEAGLLKQTPEGYVVDRLVLENFIRLNRTLVPKHFLHSLFFAAAIVIELTVFRPSQLTREYAFAMLIMTGAMAFSIYETIVTLLKKKL